MDEKFYLSDEQVEKYMARNEKAEENDLNFRFEPYDPRDKKIAKTIQAKTWRHTDNYLIVKD